MYDIRDLKYFFKKIMTLFRLNLLKYQIGTVHLLRNAFRGEARAYPEIFIRRGFELFLYGRENLEGFWIFLLKTLAN